MTVLKNAFEGFNLNCIFPIIQDLREPLCEQRKSYCWRRDHKIYYCSDCGREYFGVGSETIWSRSGGLE